MKLYHLHSPRRTCPPCTILHAGNSFNNCIYFIYYPIIITFKFFHIYTLILQWCDRCVRYVVILIRIFLVSIHEFFFQPVICNWEILYTWSLRNRHLTKKTRKKEKKKRHLYYALLITIYLTNITYLSFYCKKKKNVSLCNYGF